MVFVICVSAHENNRNRSASLLLCCLLRFELLWCDHIQLSFHGQKQLFVGRFLLLLTFLLDIVALLKFCLFDGLLDLNLLLGLLPLFAECDASLLHIVAFDNLVVPEVLNLTLFVLLRLAQVSGDFLEIQSAILFVTVGHELTASATVADLLELEVSDGLGGQGHLDGRFVRLVVEVPNVDPVVLSDEDNAWACRAEGATSVL
jgi:hypothetical protein